MDKCKCGANKTAPVNITKGLAVGTAHTWMSVLSSDIAKTCKFRKMIGMCKSHQRISNG